MDFCLFVCLFGPTWAFCKESNCMHVTEEAVVGLLVAIDDAADASKGHSSL